MKEAIVYIRVSTAMQVDEGISLEAQQAKAEAWCDLNDYTLKQVFTDAGISGKRTYNREGLQSALAACGEGDVLVVYSLSRLARSTMDTLEIGDYLRRNGTDLVSISEKIDTTSASGKMVFRLLAVMAEFESDQVSDRTRTALQHKKANNERIGSIPYGKQLHKNGVDLLPNESEKDAITLIKQLNKNGFSLHGIARRLNKSEHQPRGTKWYAQTIKRVLA